MSRSARLAPTLLLATLLGLGAALPATDRPNVLILFTDDQGTLDAGCYGSDDLFTPTIDALAARRSSAFRLSPELITEHVHAALQMACWSLREGLLDSL